MATFKRTVFDILTTQCAAVHFFSVAARRVLRNKIDSQCRCPQ